MANEFDTFDALLQPSPSQRNRADLRSRRLSELLAESNNIAECRLVGSFTRSTAIRRYSDTDILAVFDPAKVDSKNPKDLLALTEQIIKPLGRTVIRSPITVSLQYPDWPNVDILPGFAAGGREREGFHIPTEAGTTWQLYSPGQHDRIVSDASKRLGSRLKKLIRIIKWWNYTNGTFLKSYEIEEFVVNAFPARIPDYTEAIYNIFNEIIKKLADDRSRNNNARFMISTRARDAWLISRQAQELTTSGRDKEDVESLLRRLFGEQFPHVRC